MKKKEIIAQLKIRMALLDNEAKKAAEEKDFQTASHNRARISGLKDALVIVEAVK